MPLKRSFTVACLALLATPTPAWAVDFDAPDAFSTLTGALSLLVAIVLLIIVVRLSRVAQGSAMAENISFVVAGTVCLAASVLLGWVDRFIASWFTVDQVRGAADLLVVAAMFFLAVYFAQVRRALTSFVRNLPPDYAIAASHLPEGAEPSSLRDGEARG